jgi:UDP-N-acetylmuramate-alanine ligase
MYIPDFCGPPRAIATVLLAIEWAVNQQQPISAVWMLRPEYRLWPLLANALRALHQTAHVVAAESRIVDKSSRDTDVAGQSGVPSPRAYGIMRAVILSRRV